MNNYDYILKILIIGSSGVGKSSILNSYVENDFKENTIQTIGVDFKLIIRDYLNKKIKLQIWDTAGHERFRTITNSYYRGTDAVILVFDLSRENTFKEIVYWISEIKSNASDDILIYLVGNKNDLPKKVKKDTIKNFVLRLQIPYIETSAKNSFNLEILFDEIIRELYETKINDSNYLMHHDLQNKVLLKGTKIKSNKPSKCC
jgi:Ras-related protein Rab-1A